MSGSNLYSQGFGTTSSNTFPSNPIISTRTPTSTDTKGPMGNLPLGQQWVDETIPAVYVLAKLSSSNGAVTANWVLSAVNSGDIETITGNSGAVTPTSNNVNVVGTGDISTSGSGDTLTISYTAGTSGIDQVNGDTGSATPSSGEITISGTTKQMSTTGSGSTITIALDNEIVSTPITAESTSNITALGTGTGSAAGGQDITLIGANAGTANTVDQTTAVGTGALSSNVTGAANTALGYNSLTANTGNANTAVGNLALTANTSGGENTAIGTGAAQASTIVSNVTAVGSNALSLNEAAGCTAVGSSALRNNVTGTGNTAVGLNTLTSSTSSDNTAIGDNALPSLVGNGECTAVGKSALLLNTGDQNTAVGCLAGASIVSGTAFTALGYKAGTLTTGTFTTAIGYNALSSNTTGQSNAAVGDGCLGLNNANDNTAIGSGALNVVTGGTGNCAMGHLSGSSYTGSESNNITIGASVTGTLGESNAIRLGNASNTTCFVTAIRGVTTANADAVAVLVDSANQLGTISSSVRYKENINPITVEQSERIYNLKPVQFKYKSQSSDRPQWGLIAEEVHEVIPEIVVKNAEGEIDTVQYQTLPIFLLAEVQRLKKEIEDLKAGKCVSK